MYCVYLTIYDGDKMPKFYVGSTSIDRIKKGYYGSVKSKKYKNIWADELNNNSHLFDIIILNEYDSRIKALEGELTIQKKLNVVQNLSFINESFATPNGFFGRKTTGKDHPMFGRKHSNATKEKISSRHYASGKDHRLFGKGQFYDWKNKNHTEEAKRKMSQNHWNCSGENNPMHGRKGDDHPWFGKKQTEEAKEKMKGSKPVITCPYCGKSGGKPAMIRFHFLNCKNYRDDGPSLNAVPTFGQ